ncbi:MAG TPA: hypothetical protein VHO24_02050 [Opitutaceae bacterium]|nr:hypothetical protein [Opitutaceae bacterium]
MALLVGVVLALVLGIFGSVVGFDRDRSYYATVLAVIGLLYGLFAVMSGSTTTLLLEGIGIVVFLILSVLGFKISQWFLVAGLAAHGVYDYFHGHLFANSGVPAFWPMFCGSYDITAAAYLAWLLRRRRAPTRTT